MRRGRKMANERAVNCPKCGGQIGTTPDGKSLRAGKGSVLQGKAAVLHSTEGLIAREVEGHGAVEVGCLGCGETFAVGDALSAPQSGAIGAPGE
jgi:ribosomal protein S27E